jgi:hypothetical protein
MVMMFRKWMVPAFNRRFQREQYSFDIQDTTEGYYRTAYNFLKVLGTDLMSFKVNIAAN